MSLLPPAHIPPTLNYCPKKKPSLQSRLRKKLRQLGLSEESRHKPWGLVNILLLSSLILFFGTVLLGAAFVGLRQFRNSDYYTIHLAKSSGVEQNLFSVSGSLAASKETTTSSTQPATTTQPATPPRGSVIVRDTKYLDDARARRQADANNMAKSGLFSNKDLQNVLAQPLPPSELAASTD